MFKHVQVSLFIFLLTTACANQVATSDTSILTPPPSLNEYFPQMVITPSTYLDLPPIEGELVLENGCLRIDGENDLIGGNSFLLVWDTRFSAITRQGLVSVVDSNTGEVLVSVGDHIILASNGSPTHPTINPIPEECTGPYLAVGEFIRKKED
jgi:hypothetical protein